MMFGNIAEWAAYAAIAGIAMGLFIEKKSGGAPASETTRADAESKAVANESLDIQPRTSD